ncbi:MAG: VCBS repeat-containing protein [Ignavibacteria bacterium]|nr:VCBS repeat-containing protein [Ignavibacteria bacterium]
MKHFILLVSLILLSSSAIRDNYKEQPSLADPNNPLSLTCPDYLPAEYKISEKPNGVFQEAVLTGADQSWYSAAVENIMKEEYNISYSEEIKSYQSPNRANNLQFTYHTNGFTAKPRETKIPLFDVNDRMLSEKDKKYEEMEEWSVIFGIENEEFGIKNEEFTSSGNKTSIENENIRIDYTNTKEGMRQDFIIKEKISSDEGLELLMNVSTDLEMNVSKDAVTFRSGRDGKDKMMYASLKAWDVRGKTLDAYFEKRSEIGFAIVVNDEDAVYPVTVDPLSTTPDWMRGSWFTGSNYLSVADAGDINLDGYSDLIIGVPGQEGNNGIVIVHYGGPGGLNADRKWEYSDPYKNPRTEFARSVAACDINGDGYSDIIIGEPNYSNGQLNEGRIHVYFGTTDGLLDSADWKYESNVEYAKLGYSLSTAGDYNGDGYDDVVAGAPGYPNNYLSAHGRVLVFLGSASGLSDGPVYSFINWMDGYTGMGDEVACAGDINGDGYDDVIIGEPYWPPPPSGPGDSQYESNGRFSVSLGSPNGHSGWGGGGIGDDNFSLFGYSVSSAGDVNNDGFDDVIVGAPNYYPGSGNFGKTYLYLGSPLGLTFAWSLSNQDQGFGSSISAAGDLNGDGFDDVIIGAHYTQWDLTSDTSGSSAYVFYGSANGLKSTHDWYYILANHSFIAVTTIGDVNGDGYSDLLTGSLLLEETQWGNLKPEYYAFYGGNVVLDPAPDWTVNGTGHFGISVSDAGDVNGDGYSDVMIGSPSQLNSAGKVYVYHGSSLGLNTSPDWTAVGDSGSLFGESVSSAGDVNNDGYDDVIIGARGYLNGRAYVFHGSPTGLVANPSWLRDSYSPGTWFGYSVSGAGDVNGDNFSDVVIGMFNYYYQGSRRIGAYIYTGSSSGLSQEAAWTASSELDISFGRSVSDAGDVNGDGYDDVIVGGNAGLLFYGHPDKGMYEDADWTSPYLSAFV